MFDSIFAILYVLAWKKNMNSTAENTVVSLTENAAKQIKEMLANEKDTTKKALRVYVESGGCSGLQYGMLFDEIRADDLTAEFNGVFVTVDPFSANYVRGSVVDFSEELVGGGFKISNPNAKQSCGCGKSFEA